MARRLKLLGISLAVVALLAVTLAGTVFADSPEEDTDYGYCGGQGWHGFGEGAFCTDAVSDLLGLTPEEIHEQRLEGMSLAEIATAQGVTVDELVAAIMAEKTAAVQSRVDAGTITAEQAELILQQMEERTLEAVNRTTTGPAGWSNGRGYGQSGQGAGPGMMNRRGAGIGPGACAADGAFGAGPGGMHRWGGSR